jgi:hypothetical protein
MRIKQAPHTDDQTKPTASEDGADYSVSHCTPCHEKYPFKRRKPLDERCRCQELLYVLMHIFLSSFNSHGRTLAALPDSIKRVGTAEAFPNEYPGQVYAFNWCLNGDGVTPLRKSAFRITKPLDLKIAGLEPPKAKPLKVWYIFVLYIVALLSMYIFLIPLKIRLKRHQLP